MHSYRRLLRRQTLPCDHLPKKSQQHQSLVYRSQWNQLARFMFYSLIWLTALTGYSLPVRRDQDVGSVKGVKWKKTVVTASLVLTSRNLMDLAERSNVYKCESTIIVHATRSACSHSHHSCVGSLLFTVKSAMTEYHKIVDCQTHSKLSTVDVQSLEIDLRGFWRWRTQSQVCTCGILCSAMSGF